MKLNKITILLALFCAFAMACSHQAKVADNNSDAANTTDANRDPAAQAKPIQMDKALKEAATGALKFNEAHLLIDNDEAFESKINALRSAGSGDVVRMVYYIFSNDESSSVFIKEVLAAAQRGAKVNILVDLLTNYAKLDLFKWMEANGSGNVQIRLYGRPSEVVIKDAMYMTRPCPNPSKAVPGSKECQIFKWGQINAELDNLSVNGVKCTKSEKMKNSGLKVRCEAAEREHKEFYASLFLAGLYGKSGPAAQVAFAYGSDIASTNAQKAATTADQKAKLKKLIKMVIDAKVFGDTSAYFKLGLAMMFYANDVNPALNQIYGRFPFDTPDPDTPPAKQETAMEHWQHITDYTHHKLLLVGSQSSARFMQLGGRNIENSYHMKFNEKFSKKYTFADTDFAANLTSGGESMVSAFDNMWNYTDVVAPVSVVGEFLSSDLGFNGGAIAVASDICKNQLAVKTQVGSDPTKTTVRKDMENCLLATYKQIKQDVVVPAVGTAKKEQRFARYRSPEERIAEAGAAVETNAAKYLSQYSAASGRQSFRNTGYNVAGSADSSLSNGDLGADIYYIENLPWMREPKTKRINPAQKERTLNFNNGEEMMNNKNIHYLWLEAMKATCNPKATEKTEIILHSAYWFPAVNMMEVFRSMVDGSLPCGNVVVKIITNSFQTTDLNILNVFARYQMKAFYMVYNAFKDTDMKNKTNKAATFEYYEYKPFAGTTANQLVSLHTKLSLIGNDMIVGSANADIRSFMMDTNNGVYIRNAPNLAADYRRWIASILPAPGQTESEWVREASGKLANDKVIAIQKSSTLTQAQKSVEVRKIKRSELAQFHQPLGEDMDLSVENKPKGNFGCPIQFLQTYDPRVAPIPATTGTMRDDDMCIMEALGMKYPGIKRNAENFQTMKEIQRATATDIFTDMLGLMSINAKVKFGGQEEQELARKLELMQQNKGKVGNDFNRKYQVF